MAVCFLLHRSLPIYSRFTIDFQSKISFVLLYIRLLSSFRYVILYIPRLIFLCFFSVVFSVVFSFWKFAVPLRIVPRRNLICSIRKSVFTCRFFIFVSLLWNFKSSVYFLFVIPHSRSSATGQIFAVTLLFVVM